MKKIASLFLSVVLMMSILVVPDYEKVYANPALSVSVSSSSVIIGDTVSTTVSVPTGYGAQVDIRFPAGLLSYSEATTSNINVSNGQVTLNMYEALGTSTVTIKFKAVSSGDATIEAVVVKAGDENGDEVQMNGASKTVTIQNKAAQNTEKSDDNSLSALKLSAGTLSPAFKYNVTNYTATVDYNVSSVVVSATKSNDKATIESVTGNGKVSLKVGENLIEIIVKAENGEKVTYKIVVTRKAQEGGGQSTEDTSSETETDTEENIEGVDSGFSWNGSALVFTENIPTDVIPAGFSKETMMLNNVEIPCVNSNKSTLTLLYLKTSDGKGALYVYDRDEQNVYPFIKLTSNDRYVIVLQPEELSAPKGYEMFSLSLEGKGVVTACRYIITESGDDVVDAQMADFYLLYCMNNEGYFGWYQYDSVEKTFQRYTGIAPIEKPSDTETNSEIGEFDDDNADNNELKAQLKEEQDKNLKMICIFVFVLAVLLVVIFNLILSRQKTDEDIDEEESDENEPDDEDTEEFEEDSMGEETAEEELEAKESEDIKSDDIKLEEKKEINNEEVINDDTFIEDISAKLLEEAAKNAESCEDEEDDDFEFIDL